MGALEALEARGAEECCLVVVDGLPGLGKTTILSRWAADNACVYLRAKVEWSPYWLLGELLKEMRIEPPHGYERRFGAAFADDDMDVIEEEAMAFLIGTVGSSRRT